MAQLTRAQLVQQLEASHVAYAKLEERCAAAEARLAHRALGNVYRGKPVRPLTAEVMAAHEQYVEKLSAARELAIRTGKAVRV